MIIKKLRAERYIKRTLLVLGRPEGSLLAQIASRNAVRQPFVSAIETYVVLLCEGGLEDLVVPVGRSITKLCSECVTGSCPDRVCLGYEGSILVSGHDIQTVGILAKAEAAVIGNLRLSGDTLLGRNDDNAVGSAGSIDGSRRSILEDSETLDIIGIDSFERVGHTLTTIDCKRNAIDNDERVIRCLQGCGTTDSDCRSATWTAIPRDNLQTCDLTLEHVLGRYDRSAVKLLGLDRSDRSGHIILLDGTVTDDNDVIEEFAILHDGHDCRNCGSLE